SGIVVIMLLAWAYSRLLAGSEALADVGAVSFSALATLVPALCFAAWRPQTPPRAAVAGVLAGFAVWCWVLLLPLAMPLRGAPAAGLQQGRFGGAWLSPDGVCGRTGGSRLGRAVGARLVVGTAVTLPFPVWRRDAAHRVRGGRDAQTLRSAGIRFLPRE